MAILQEICEILVGGLTSLGTGIGSGINNAVQNLFITTGEGGAQTLSTFGIVIAIFGGIALAVGGRGEVKPTLNRVKSVEIESRQYRDNLIHCV